jgi:hypothetical protein
MLGWAHDVFHEKCIMTCYAKHVFLHHVGSAGDVVNFGVSRPRNVESLFFMFGWDWYRFDKKRVRTHYAKLVFLH